jgi:hypothetical protein
MTVGYAVFDRQTGRFTERRNSSMRFRSEVRAADVRDPTGGQAGLVGVRRQSAVLGEDPRAGPAQRCLHTTGTTGRNSRFVVALFTLHAKGTRYATACAKVTKLTRYLVPAKR